MRQRGNCDAKSKRVKNYGKERKIHELQMSPRPQLAGREITYPERALKISAKACTVIGPVNARQAIQHLEQKKGLLKIGQKIQKIGNEHLVSVLIASLNIAPVLVKMDSESA